MCQGGPLGGVAGQQGHDRIAERAQSLPVGRRHACIFPWQVLTLDALDLVHHLHSTSICITIQEHFDSTCAGLHNVLLFIFYVTTES